MEPQSVAEFAPVADRSGSWPDLRGHVRALVRAAPAIAGGFAFHAVAYAVMIALALWSELRPAPTLPDTLLAHVPYVPWVARVNYLAWLVLYVPLSAYLLWDAPRRWARFMVAGGVVSIARGVCIALTGLGPPDPAHAGRGIRGMHAFDAYLELISPFGVFSRNAMHAYLTKDLFFSGHTATTFLLVLYLWPYRRARALALVAHVVVVATVVLAHLHYSIDIIGAYAVTYCVFAVWERGAATHPHPPALRATPLSDAERGGRVRRRS